MPIRVTCQHCGKQFAAWEDLVGKVVQCPKCQHRMRVSHGVEPSGDSASSRTDSPPQSASQPAPPPSFPSSTPPSQTPQPAFTRRHKAEEDRFDDSEDLPLACPHCHEPMSASDDMCEYCGYHRILKKVLEVEGLRKHDAGTGFERFMKQHLVEGENAQHVLLLTKIVVCLGFLMLVAVVFLCTGSLWILLLFLGVLALALVYFIVQLIRNGGSVNKDPISVGVWSFFLAAQRLLGWRALRWPFSTLRTLTLHDPGLTDKDLADLQLKDFDSLDLEGTHITDAGLVHLEREKQLQFLVIRHTQVTDEGVQRLQHKLQRTIIWH